MSDMISRDAAIRAMVQAHEETGVKTAQAIRIIRELPTADVEERKKGKWKLNKDGNWACPFCEFDPYHYNMKGMNYCPNCGADLRGGSDG